ncbi:MAG TPA: TetR/AcrR family transcriptional regulator [Thermoanaerobaculia bacterium]|nr:TetR/AcrR family transcriptional regulator [Thermoanaerobaculia bacterium]
MIAPQHEHPPAPEAGTTHERLLSAAAQLLAERGYGGTSMADIAQRVGVRKASLYNYYASKEELLMELLRSSLAAWDDCCLEALEVSGPAERRLWSYVRSAVDFTVEHPEQVAIFRVAAAQVGEPGLKDRVMAVLGEHRHRHRAALEAFFTEALAAGEVAPADPRDLSYVFRMFMQGVLASHLVCCHGDEQLSPQRLESVWRVFWDGLGRGEDA